MKLYVFVLLFVFLSALAAYLRFYIAGSTNSIWSIPVVNALGCLLIGLLFSLKLNQLISEGLWVLLAVIFLGAFTTFSSYVLDLMKLLIDKNYLLLTQYVLVTHLFAVLLCFVGFRLGNKFFS